MNKMKAIKKDKVVKVEVIDKYESFAVYLHKKDYKPAVIFLCFVIHSEKGMPESGWYYPFSTYVGTYYEAVDLEDFIELDGRLYTKPHIKITTVDSKEEIKQFDSFDEAVTFANIFISADDIHF